jgi:hypothetical protein
MLERADCRKARRLRRHGVASGPSLLRYPTEDTALNIAYLWLPYCTSTDPCGATYSRIALNCIIS